MTLAKARLLLTLSLMAGLYLGPVEAKSKDRRIVAIADIHGSYSGLVGILKAAKVVDDNLDWSGGNTILAQTGDFLDRGPDVRKVMDLLMRLEAQAPRHGGRVQVALGNHEVVNLLNQFQDDWVTPEICASFADETSASARDAAFEKLTAWRQRFPRLQPETKEDWIASFPLGFLEYQEAIGPDGIYGKWLRGLPIVLRIQDTIFMHSGISAEYAVFSVKELNTRVSKEIKIFDQVRARLIEEGLILPFFTLREITETIGLRASQLNSDPDEGNAVERQLLYTLWKQLESMQWLGAENGPLWYRGYSRLSDSDLQSLFDILMKKYKVERFVVGHTPVRPATIKTRLDGRFFLIDTGMLLSHYHGQASALEFQDNKITEIYPIAADTPHPRGENAHSSTRSRRPLLDVRLASWGASDQAPNEAQATPPRLFLSPDGNPAQIQTHDEALEFLRTAPIVATKALSVGVSKPLMLSLEKNGVTAHAVFHHIDETKRRAQMGSGKIINHFIDSYRSQIAAYEISRALEMTNVPPTVARSVDGRTGSVQLWIEGAITEHSRVKSSQRPLRPNYYQQQLYDKEIFHNLVNNIDPNQGNILWDKNENIWLIDHTRSFGTDNKLAEPLKVRRCSRDLWERLKSLDRAAIQEQLNPYIGKWEVKAMFVRLNLMLRILEKKISALGESKVLFNYGEPMMDIQYSDPSKSDSPESSSELVITGELSALRT